MSSWVWMLSLLQKRHNWNPVWSLWLTDKTGTVFTNTKMEPSLQALIDRQDWVGIEMCGTTQARPRLAFCLWGPMSFVHGSVNGKRTLFGIWDTLIFTFRILGSYLGYLHTTTVFGARLFSQEENISTDPTAGVFVSPDRTDTKSWRGYCWRRMVQCSEVIGIPIWIRILEHSLE